MGLGLGLGSRVCTEERCTTTPTLRIDHGLQGTPPLSTRAEAENSETTIAPG